MLKFLDEINLYLWIPVILVSIMVIAGVFAPLIYRTVTGWLSGTRSGRSSGSDTIYELLADAGYSYDPDQDIFYSNMNPWQRQMGYCRLYDEAAAPLSMIIDCEPIKFEYGGKRWMIEFWKGQYGMTTGAEIGVYTTEGPDLSIPGFFDGTFYYCASDSDLLYMTYSLVKNDKVLFERSDKHWWLTGFKLGEFSEPSELTMYLTIAIKNDDMRNAFVEGLMEAGYSEDEFFTDRDEIGVVFGMPHSPQPLTRIDETDWLTQRKNEMLCIKYQEITGPYEAFPDKLKAIREQAPEIYDAVINIGKTKPLFEVYEKIKGYLS